MAGLVSHVDREAWIAWREAVARVVSLYSFRAPMPIRFSVEDERDAAGTLRIVAMLETVDVEDPAGKARIAVHAMDVLPYDRDLAHDVRAHRLEAIEKVVRSVHERVRVTAREVWLHEFREWFRCDGKPVEDPHAHEPKR